MSPEAQTQSRESAAAVREHLADLTPEERTQLETDLEAYRRSDASQAAAFESPDSGLEEPGSEEHQGAKSESDGLPRLTDGAETALSKRIAQVDKALRNLAQVDALKQDLSLAHRPQMERAWRRFLRHKNLKNKRISWVCGGFSGGIFSFIVTLLRETPPPFWAIVGLLVVFAITLVVGWNSIK